MTESNNIKQIVIVGGGTSGWMVAAAMGKVFQGKECSITLIESEEIGTVGVGEATIPAILYFNKIIGLDEDDFLKFTHGTFKLGIEFVNWGSVGDSYFHPFGSYGTRIDRLAFQHYWQKLFNKGLVPDIQEFSFNVMASKANRFVRPVDIENSPLQEVAYAFHFDAGLYAQYLRGMAEKMGVRRINNLVERVNLRGRDGFIESVSLKTGECIEGELFIDCSGFRGLLIEEALKTGYDDWSHYLPCNRAVTVASKRLDPLPPYTRATALEAGWQWRIPLQHRTGNGYVFCDQYISDDRAVETLLSNIEGEPLAQPRFLKFLTGKRKKFWNKNCVAIGLASGFMEPLESTSIHLVQAAISKLIDLFPNADFCPEVIEKFNAQLSFEYQSIRDFLILHYKATSRADSAFWNYCRDMEVPQSLLDKIALYKEGGRVYRDSDESFSGISWLSVFRGQGITTEKYNPVADVYDEERLVARLKNIHEVIQRSVVACPTHEAFIEQYCKSIR
ncbi:MAG: tryptophan halogenase family protein [Marinagarivorans sp.]